MIWRILLEALFSNASPAGKLPCELPNTMKAVRHQRSDAPRDQNNQLLEYGYGMEYGRSGGKLFACAPAPH